MGHTIRHDELCHMSTLDCNRVNNRSQCDALPSTPLLKSPPDQRLNLQGLVGVYYHNVNLHLNAHMLHNLVVIGDDSMDLWCALLALGFEGYGQSIQQRQYAPG